MNVNLEQAYQNVSAPGEFITGESVLIMSACTGRALSELPKSISEYFKCHRFKHNKT